jgi:WhiB family redox-sensing transcriptional regulator
MTVLSRSVASPWPLDDPLAWIDDAACRGYPVDVFFPDKGGSYGEARAVCRRCPVVDRCRDEIDRVERGLTSVDVQGLYAGETPGERRRRRREARGHLELTVP